MTTTPLITLEDIRAMKSIALNVQQAKDLTPYVLEAQNFDLGKLLGDAFYLALINDFTASPSLDVYADLFNGGSYVHDSETYYNYGIKKLIVHYAYTRYVANSNVIATPTGFVHKTNPHSDNVTDKTVARLTDNARSSALFVEDSVRNYLDRKNNDYPLWKRACKTRINRTKIRQV